MQEVRLANGEELVTAPLVVHARMAPARTTRHHTGRMTPLTGGDNDPRGWTVCGADPTDRDLSNRSARSAAHRHHLTCEACLQILDGEIRPCRDCDGMGEIATMQATPDLDEIVTECRACAGSGRAS